MAEVITRFKLETTQFDSKLRDAAKGLKEVVHQAELGGKGFGGFSDKSVEAARALGQIESGANNTKDKLKDLVGSFNDAARAYNNLTKEQQQSDFGKAMSQSLGQLSDRIKQTKEELYSLGDAEQVKGKSGLFGDGGLTGMLQVAGGNLLAQGITKLGSEITDTIQQSIELARQGEGVRIAFERLNRPGLLDNLKESTHGTVSELELMKAAVKFDDFKLPVEQLGTMLEFAQKKAKDTGQSVDYMVDSIVTGLGRKSLMILDNLGLSAAQVKDKMKETGDMTKAVAEIIKEQMSEAGEYVETAADRAARAAADAQNQMYDLGKSAMPIAEEFAQMWNTIKIGAMDLLNTAIGPLARSLASIQRILNGGGFGFKSGIPNLGNGPAASQRRQPGRDHVVQAPGGYVEVTDSNTGAVIGGRHFDNLEDTNSINGWKKGLFKTTHAKGGYGGGGGLAESDFEKFLHQSTFNVEKLKGSDIPDMMSVWGTMSDETKNKFLDLSGAVVNMNDSFDNLKTWSDDFDLFEQLQKELQQERMAFDMAAQSAQNFGAALAGLEDPGLKAAGTVIQAIASIALGFAQASVQASLLGPIGWMAWLVAGTSALAQTVSMVHSITGFANGGEIKGNSYSGDNIMAQGPDGGLIGLNAGEIVLNKAGQASLASQLQNQGRQQSVVGVVKGENIVLVANRYLKRSGQGELVTWGN